MRKSIVVIVVILYQLYLGETIEFQKKKKTQCVNSCPFLDYHQLKQDALALLNEEADYFIYDQLIDDEQIQGIFKDMTFAEAVLPNREAEVIRDKDQIGTYYEDRIAINIHLTHMTKAEMKQLQAYSLMNDCLTQLLDDLLPHLRKGYLFRELFDTQYQTYGPGGFFKIHIDTDSDPYTVLPDNDDSILARIFTFLIYLTPDWKPSDGGGLTLHLSGGDTKVDTYQGRIVFFRSDKVWHTAENVYTQKYLLTYWVHIKRDPNYKFKSQKAMQISERNQRILDGISNISAISYDIEDEIDYLDIVTEGVYQMKDQVYEIKDSLVDLFKKKESLKIDPKFNELITKLGGSIDS